MRIDETGQHHPPAGIQGRLARSVWTTGCKSWYLDANGKNTTLWPGFTFVYRRETAKFHARSYVLASTPAPTQNATINPIRFASLRRPTRSRRDRAAGECP